MKKVQLPGEKMTVIISDVETEVRNRRYKYCTIDTMDYGQFLAKVAYSEYSKAWEPSEVFFNEEWISIDEFDDMEGYNIYGCENYRKTI